MSTMSYKGFHARVGFDENDEIFTGRISGIQDIVGFHGDSVTSLKAAFHEAVDDYLETCASSAEALLGKGDVSRRPGNPPQSRNCRRALWQEPQSVGGGDPGKGG